MSWFDKPRREVAEKRYTFISPEAAATSMVQNFPIMGYIGQGIERDRIEWSAVYLRGVADQMPSGNNVREIAKMLDALLLSLYDTMGYIQEVKDE
jgi:hypothetical protein